LFIEIAIAIGIELYWLRHSQGLFLLSCVYVHFSWRQEKHQKNRPGPNKAFTRGCAAMDGACHWYPGGVYKRYCFSGDSLVL